MGYHPERVRGSGQGQSLPSGVEGRWWNTRPRWDSAGSRYLRAMSSSLGDSSPVAFVVAVILAAGLAMLIFRHADRHGSRHATAWGLLTFLAALIVIPVYFLNYWIGKHNHPS